MEPKFTNKTNIPLELAVWLLHDEYDYVDEPNYISATSLLKPIRQILLPPRIPPENRIQYDVQDLIPSSMGHALHAAVEKAWKEGHYKRSLRLLGYSEDLINRILVNPTPEQLQAVKDPIPVYVEQRSFKELDGYKIGGKFDMVAEGRLSDVKSTSVWSYIKGNRDDDFKKQMSIYRWLRPDIITSDIATIHFIFTDWQKTEVDRIEGYPPNRIMSKEIVLMSLKETEDWIRGKLALIDQYKNVEEPLLPPCTDEELWLTDHKFQYYADPTKATTGGRATKNFYVKDYGSVEAARMAAHQYCSQKGKGIVVEVPGTPRRCAYCPAFPICTQKNQYFPEGIIHD